MTTQPSRPLRSFTASSNDEVLADLCDNINGRIHGPPVGEFVLHRNDIVQKSTEAIAAHHLLSSPIPSPLQFLSWFSSASSQNVHGSRWSWHTETSSSEADLFLKPLETLIERPWQSVQAVGHFCQDDSTAYRAGLLTLCLHAHNVFINQPLRRFLSGLYIYQSQLELWMFDRSGIWCCQAFSIWDNPKKFLAMILSYRSMSDWDLGSGHVIEHDEGGNFITLDDMAAPSLQNLYLEGQTIALSDDLVGQGTTCYRAKSPGSDQWGYVVKFKWRPADRRPEEQMLRLAIQKNVWGVVSLHYNKDMESTANLRQGLPFGPYYEFITPYHSTEQAEIRKGHGQEEYNIFSVTRPTKKLFQNRVFTCVVTSPVGRPLQFFETRLELLLALRDAIRAHRSLFQDAKMLHQDVSAWNIIISHPQDPGDPHGILIDLDVAIDITGGPPTPGNATGTRPFMAIGILRRRIHTYRHDLESFLYVLIWVIIAKQKDYPPVGSRLRQWNQGSWIDSATLKTSDMAETNFGNVLAEFAPEYVSLKPLAERMRGLLFPMQNGELWTGTVGSAAGVNYLYDGLADAFEEAIRREKAPTA